MQERSRSPKIYSTMKEERAASTSQDATRELSKRLYGRNKKTELEMDPVRQQVLKERDEELLR